jgi:hypothetical protein
MPNEFLTPKEARALLETGDRRHAKLRAQAPPELAELYARVFPGVSDEIWRYVMEKALLGELRDTPLLPPLEHSPTRSLDDQHESNAQ